MLTWWDGSHWTDRRTPIPGGPLDPAAIIRPVTDEGAQPGLPGDDAERPGVNSGPIPVIGGSPDDSNDAVFADPTSVFEPVGRAAWTPDHDSPAVGGTYERPDDSRRGPRLWIVLVPLLLIALAAAALIVTSGSDDDGDTAGETTDQLTTIGEAVDVANEAGLPIDLPDSTVGSLIEDICDGAGDDGAETSLALRIAQLPLEAGQVHELLNALGKGAASRCPDDIASDSGLLLRTGELAIESIGGATSTTSSTATTQLAAPVTTPPDTTAVTPTTKKPTTPTTKKATPTTAAPTTVAPTTTAAACNPNYGKCLKTSGSYSCAGDSDDPDWSPYKAGSTLVSGPFTVTGSDQFGLDKDGNGIACERAPQT
jgi:cell division septation protein DedD